MDTIGYLFDTVYSGSSNPNKFLKHGFRITDHSAFQIYKLFIGLDPMTGQKP